MLHHLNEYRNPLLFDVMVIAGEFPCGLIFIVLWLEFIAFIGEGFANVFPLHEVFVIEVDLECRTCFTRTCYFLYFCYLD